MNKENELVELKDDLTYVSDYLVQISEEILDNEISKYPIFATSKNELSIGRKIISSKDFDIHWNFYASHLEDFVNKGVIKLNKVDEFIKLYKSKEKHLCLFVVFPDESKIVFTPF